jgi:hypothetical protein
MDCCPCLNYKDNPSISSKLVKFLAVNTGYEALHMLMVKMMSIETDIAAIKKEVTGASKAAHLTSNKAED